MKLDAVRRVARLSVDRVEEADAVDGHGAVERREGVQRRAANALERSPSSATF
jgi:hypothetical protein